MSGNELNRSHSDDPQHHSRGSDLTHELFKSREQTKRRDFPDQGSLRHALNPLERFLLAPGPDSLTSDTCLSEPKKDTLCETVPGRHPVAKNTVSRAMDPIIGDADFIDRILRRYGIVENPYNPVARKVRFERVQQRTMQNLLTTVAFHPDGLSEVPEEKRVANIIFSDLNQLASVVHQARECCEKVSEVETQVRTTLGNIKLMLEQHKLSGMLADRFDQKWIDTFQKKLRYACFTGAQGKNENDLAELHPFTSDARKVEEDCETVNMIVSQLKKSSDGAEGYNLQQEHYDAFLEAVHGSHERPAFKVIEQKFEDEMQKRFDSYQDKIATMASTYQDFLPPPITSNRRTNYTYSSTHNCSDVRLADLTRLSNQFKERRKEAQGKSSSERFKENRTLMETLSEIEELTQGLESWIEELIDTRFSASQSQVATNEWVNSHPDEPLAKKRKEVCKCFEEGRVKIRARSGFARTRGNMFLGEILCLIERLEDEIFEVKIKPLKDEIEAKTKLRERQMRESIEWANWIDRNRTTIYWANWMTNPGELTTAWMNWMMRKIYDN
jgi:hypothetical protein